MVDTNRVINSNTTTNEAPDSGKVALTMGAYSIVFFFILSIIFTVIHNSLF